MTFIDWSDPEEMLGLLAEYVADERAGEGEDRERAEFLDDLGAALMDLVPQAQEWSVLEVGERLRELRDSQAPEFRGDPALVHLEDCIQELERIAAEG
jgi:hypothetical protein